MQCPRRMELMSMKEGYVWFCHPAMMSIGKLFVIKRGAYHEIVSGGIVNTKI